MRKELATKWVAALRSGEYTQGSGYLMTGNDAIPHTYCCLGVLACVMGKQVEEIKGLQVLTEDMRYEADMTDAAGSRGDGHELDIRGESESWPSLAEANDDGVTFAQIANYIEANYRSL